MPLLNIVLVEPEIPQNTGNISRTCAATGAHLHIVEPMGFQIDDRRLKRAGLDYWHLVDISYYDNFSQLQEKFPAARFFYFTTKGRRRHSDVSFKDGDFLVFGKETKGLPEKLLFEHKDSCVRLPMVDDARSLNLSNSVAVGVYEALRQTGFESLKQAGSLREYEW